MEVELRWQLCWNSLIFRLKIIWNSCHSCLLLILNVWVMCYLVCPLHQPHSFVGGHVKRFKIKWPFVIFLRLTWNYTYFVKFVLIWWEWNSVSLWFFIILIILLSICYILIGQSFFFSHKMPIYTTSFSHFFYWVMIFCLTLGVLYIFWMLMHCYLCSNVFLKFGTFF